VTSDRPLAGRSPLTIGVARSRSGASPRSNPPLLAGMRRTGIPASSSWGIAPPPGAKRRKLVVQITRRLAGETGEVRITGAFSLVTVAGRASLHTGNHRIRRAFLGLGDRHTRSKNKTAKTSAPDLPNLAKTYHRDRSPIHSDQIKQQRQYGHQNCTIPGSAAKNWKVVSSTLSKVTSRRKCGTQSFQPLGDQRSIDS
jgi:hypothetical protein